jgi:hypothetical protein
MKGKAKLAVCALLAVAGLAACSKPVAKKPEVILLHTGRLRGNVYPASLQGISPLQYYPYLAGYVRKVREEAAVSGAKVFLVDLGDSLSGSFAAHVTRSRNMTTFFNEAGYDAILLSNLDAFVPEAAMQGLHCKVLSPFVAPEGANALPPAGGRLDKGNMSLFLLANFYGDTDPASQPGRFPTRFGGFKVRPVRDYGAVLRDLGPRPEKSMTVFGWMKFEPSEAPPAALFKNLRELGVDAILAHRIYGANEREAWQSNGLIDWKPPVSLNILRNNGGFALARLDLARTASGWEVLRHELVPMTADNTPADKNLVAAIEKFAPEIQAADSPLCELPSPVGVDGILDLYMAALTTIPGTNAVAYSKESIRSDWRAGTLRASDVFNSLPWESRLVQVELSKSQLELLAGLKIVRVALRDVDNDPVLLTTSGYFAELIARQPGMENVRITDLPQTSEFDFFLEYLKTNPGSVTSGLPAGWSLLGTP